MRGRKKRKHLKRHNNKHLSLGVDIDMDEVVSMADRMMVGKVRSRLWGCNALYRWMQENWGGHLQQLPQLSFLARGWLGFTASSNEDANWILREHWEIRGSPLYLQKWSPLFDDQAVVVEHEPVWVRLPHLPLNLWHPKVLEAIGNCLGVFLKADLSYMQTGRRTVARILVGLQIYKGLADKLPIQYTCGTHVHALDYEGLPFCCHRCHKWGHLVAECKKGACVNSQMSPGTKSSGERLAPSEEMWRSSTAEVSSGFIRAEIADSGHSPCYGPDME